MNSFIEIRRFIELVLLKVKLNFKSEASQSYLSYFWWVLEPALLVGVFYLVFGVFLGSGGDDFVAFLITGQIPFLWISRSISNTASSVLAGKGLFLQVKISPIFFPLVEITQDFFKILFVYFLMFCVLIVIGSAPTITWLYIPYVLILMLLYISGISIFISAIVPLVPDIRYMIGTGLMMLMFASGIFYRTEDVLLDEHASIFYLNPFATLIDFHRKLLLQNEIPSFKEVSFLFLCGILLLSFSCFVISVLSPKYPKVVK